MTVEEVNKAFEDLKSEGMKDEDLLVALGKMYQDGEITKDQLGALIDQLGYEFTEDFAKMSDEDSKNNLFSEEEGEEPEEEGEEPKAEEEEPEEEGKEEEEPESEPEEDEEEEKKKAMSLFGRD